MNANERIRYYKLTDDVVESVRVFKHSSNGGQYKVRINKKDKQALVIDANTEIIAASNTLADGTRLRYEARSLLEQLLSADNGKGLNTEKRAARKKTV